VLNLHPPFRRATPDDARALGELINGAGRVTAQPRANMRPEDAVVGGDPGELFAALVGRPDKEADAWRIEALAVAPGRSFDEFGTRLLAVADALAADEGLRSVSLVLETVSEEVRAIVDREGFRPDGTGQGGERGLSMTRPVVPQG
jgi:N-acetylglutamate synthase-like GNAT family acetyltransferase